MTSTKKILIIGGNGMLGQDLNNSFSNDKNYEVTSWDKEDLDITNKEEVLQKISELSPEIIVNAAAYTNVEGCEDNKEICTKVNGRAVRYLARACKEANAILVHYSTDYVFDGNKKEGYKENDTETNPINTYGESKLIGEKEIKRDLDKYYILRTSWLFGKNGKNFVETMLNLAKDHKELKVINDQHGKPTYTSDLAERTKEIIENPEDFGIYHVTNEDETTWYEFACEIFKQAKKKVKVTPCTSEEYPTKAKRPHYSSLINTKLPKIRSWREALKDYLQK